MRRALAEDFGRMKDVDFTMTLDARFPEERGPWTTVCVSPGEEPDVFARLAATSDLTLCIAPETGGILLDRARTIEEAGGRSLGSSPAAIALTSDKIKTAEFLVGSGVNMPRGLRVVPSNGLPRDFPYPAVLKPIDGAGSVDTFFVEAQDQVPVEALAMPEALLQPFVAGVPMSASFVVLDREPILAMLIGECRQRMERRGSRLAYVGGVVPGLAKDLSQARRAVESVEGLRGWVGVDFVWDEGLQRAMILEINPRVTTSYIGLRRLVPKRALAQSILACGDTSVPLHPCAHRGFMSHQPALVFDAGGKITRAGDSSYE